jgi:hypothetical protein
MDYDADLEAPVSREMTIVRYEPSLKAHWDGFVAGAKNATFLFLRDYMDYHAARFVDESLMVYSNGAELLALLPANGEGGVVRSHGGLTYGGLVTDRQMTLPTMLEAFPRILESLRSRGFRRLVYKTVPAIYHVAPAEEDRYALTRHGAALVRRDVLAVIDHRLPLPWQERRRRGASRARREGVAIRQSDDFAAYWSILSRNLEGRHGVAPVHSEVEMGGLVARFPAEIQLKAAFQGEEMIAGIVLYMSTRVCHVQYIATSEEGRRSGALDLLFEETIRENESKVQYFDFGASTEDEGRVLNQGLMEQKEGFGARTVVHDHYELDL